jgi:hypothetical protein
MDGFAPPAGAMYAMFPDEQELLQQEWDAYGAVVDTSELRKTDGACCFWPVRGRLHCWDAAPRACAVAVCSVTECNHASTLWEKKMDPSVCRLSVTASGALLSPCCRSASRQAGLRACPAQQNPTGAPGRTAHRPCAARCFRTGHSFYSTYQQEESISIQLSLRCCTPAAAAALLAASELLPKLHVTDALEAGAAAAEEEDQDVEDVPTKVGLADLCRGCCAGDSGRTCRLYERTLQSVAQQCCRS